MSTVCDPIIVADETLEYQVTLRRERAEALVEHYADDPRVRSVTDALRQAARDVTADE